MSSDNASWFPKWKMAVFIVNTIVRCTQIRQAVRSAYLKEEKPSKLELLEHYRVRQYYIEKMTSSLARGSSIYFMGLNRKSGVHLLTRSCQQQTGQSNTFLVHSVLFCSVLITVIQFYSKLNYFQSSLSQM